MDNIVEQNEYFFKEAAVEARKALCLRDKCGAVIVMDGEVIGRGYNAPPNDNINHRQCNLDYRTSSKPKSDRTCCMHAEWRAIIDAIKNTKDISSSSLYFARVDNEGNMLKSGEPYCTVCSRLALDTGIKYFGLWHESGIKMYNTEEYDDLSYNFHKDK